MLGDIVTVYEGDVVVVEAQWPDEDRLKIENEAEKLDHTWDLSRTRTTLSAQESLESVSASIPQGVFLLVL
jgi:hypothetical protein